MMSVKFPLQAWYMDRALAGGRHSVVLRALHQVEGLGPAMGPFHVNVAKCELFSGKGSTSFPPAVHEVLLAFLPNPVCA